MNLKADTELKQLEKELRSAFPREEIAIPTKEETTLLLSALQGEFDTLRSDSVHHSSVVAAAEGKELARGKDGEEREASRNDRISSGFWTTGTVTMPSLRHLLKSQMRRNQRAILGAGSALFIMLAFLVDPYQPYNPYSNSGMTIFAMTTPLLLLSAMLFNLKSGDRGLRAVERITPYPLPLIAYCRMLLTFLTVLTLALVSTGILYFRIVTVGGDLSYFGHFILMWLGVTLLTGGTAMALLFYKGMKSALLGSSIVYLLWLLAQQLFYLTDLSGVSAGIEPLWMNSFVFIAGIILFLISYRRGRILMTGAKKA